MKEYVQVIRYDNIGFELHNHIHKIGERFYDIFVTKLDHSVKVSHQQYEESSNVNVQGCFAFCYKYNINEINNGNLIHRKGHKRNYMYLPMDEFVYGRNMNWDLNARLINKTEENFDSSLMKHHFVLIKCDAFIQRTLKSYDRFKCVDEKISEIFLTKYQIEKYSINYFGKLKFLLLNQLGLIKVHK